MRTLEIIIITLLLTIAFVFTATGQSVLAKKAGYTFTEEQLQTVYEGAVIMEGEKLGYIKRKLVKKVLVNLFKKNPQKIATALEIVQIVVTNQENLDRISSKKFMKKVFNATMSSDKKLPSLPVELARNALAFQKISR